MYIKAAAIFESVRMTTVVTKGKCKNFKKNFQKNRNEKYI